MCYVIRQPFFTGNHFLNIIRHLVKCTPKALQTGCLCEIDACAQVAFADEDEADARHRHTLDPQHLPRRAHTFEVVRLEAAGGAEALDDGRSHIVRAAAEIALGDPRLVAGSRVFGFWGDADGSKYHAAYFDRFPDVWCHGDFCEITAHGGLVIYGRSDATLNPGGVRIGTAEIYRQVEKLHEVVESLVIGQDWPPQNPNDVRVVLFVKLREGLALDDDLTRRIRQTIRDNTTPRHVPAKVLQVADIPRTKSGKIVELAVRNVVHGRPVKNQEALANPEALAHFRDRAELQG